ncbi:DUF2058 family protein [Rhodanobacter sp. 7MK24]|uniref:DUF2058 domain-containing protein n=1 Tax=Rhodanobacter sp. 7MK24 TaxID=2775922 RepID=UPI0017845F02|nr:DUF2058 family protein [Rhodanobacter sp. 7MK24]MBD8880934.1 DUF2058 family protein [Rhodanobacter sp. 7MK24]
MSESLRDQLLKSGLVKQIREEKRGNEGKGRPAGRPQGHGGKPQGHGGKPQGHDGKPPSSRRNQEEIDLAKAYAIRAQTEANERKRAQQEAEEQARARRERKQKIQQLLDGKVLNKAETDQVRNFEYGGKIRRIHVDAAQLVALNAGELAVVQQAGRYLLVAREIAEQVRAIDEHQLALLIDPNAARDDDGVPDDLVW